MSALGDYLRTVRAARDWSLREASAKCGISPAQLHFLERGRGPRGVEVRPSLGMIAKIAAGYGIPEDELRIRAGYLPEDSVYLSRPELRFAEKWLQNAPPEDVALFAALMRKIDADAAARTKKSRGHSAPEGAAPRSAE